MIPGTLIVVLIVALAAFVYGLTAIRRATRREREQAAWKRLHMRPVPPAQMPGAGRLHACDYMDERLCENPGGLSTVFWTVVDCEDCVEEVQRRA